jgi:hypothetical protein
VACEPDAGGPWNTGTACYCEARSQNAFEKGSVNMSVGVEYHLWEVWYLGLVLIFVETFPILVNVGQK